ncbi:eCIS core domain-containing protein [Streptomyces melanogenes]|uniref:eCIS core domain-containing protein n=1 Tax=Streptomyces melanogenes TaxID=67326 RepID=UPI003AF3E942
MRGKAESFFGNDFSRGRLHDGPVAQRAIEAMDAREGSIPGRTPTVRSRDTRTAPWCPPRTGRSRCSPGSTSPSLRRMTRMRATMRSLGAGLGIGFGLIGSDWPATSDSARRSRHQWRRWYARCSTAQQELADQLASLEPLCKLIFSDKAE